MNNSTEKILMLDDDPNLLSAFRRQLRKDFELETCSSANDALNLFKEKNNFAVVLVDMQMPQMSGVEFLKEIQKNYPDTVRLMLTGNADQKTAVRAVNEGAIFRFLNKPVSNEDITKALNDALTQHRLITAEKILLQNTLGGSVKVLTDILSVIDPDSFGQAISMREPIKEYANLIGIKNFWDLELAAMLGNIGMISLPVEITVKAKNAVPLSQTEQQILDQTPLFGKKLLANIPRLEKVAEMVYYQNKRYDGSGFPNDQVKGSAIPLGARLISITKDLLALKAKSIPFDECIKTLRSRNGYYDLQLLDNISKQIQNKTEIKNKEIFEIGLNDLCTGQIILEDVKTIDGVLLISSGNKVTEITIERIKNYAKLIGIKLPIKVNALIPGNLN